MVNTPSPVAVAYVCAPEGRALGKQRDAVTAYARAEGLVLAQIVTDRFDSFTISQVVQSATHHHARLLLVPAQARFASVCARVTHELEPDGAVCVVIGETELGTERRSLLTDALPQRTPPTRRTAPVGAAEPTGTNR